METISHNLAQREKMNANQDYPKDLITQKQIFLYNI